MLWEFLCRKDPYEKMSPPKVMMEVVHNGLRPEIPKHADEDFRALMEACWQAYISLRAHDYHSDQKARPLRRKRA